MDADKMGAEVGTSDGDVLAHVLARPGVMPEGYALPIDFIERGTPEEWEAIRPMVRRRVHYLTDRETYAAVVRPPQQYETIYLNVLPHFTRVVFTEDPEITVTDPEE